MMCERESSLRSHSDDDVNKKRLMNKNSNSLFRSFLVFEKYFLMPYCCDSLFS
jgi:hypothetical protein